MPIPHRGSRHGGGAWRGGEDSGEGMAEDDGLEVLDIDRPELPLPKPADPQQENENFKVVIRVRPPAPRELEGEKPFYNVVKVAKEEHPRGITIIEHLDTEDGRGGVYSSQCFTFDRIYDQEAGQKDVYDNTAKCAVDAVLAGYNATMIAYGQTGTGKTYTMEGVAKQRGIIPRATEDIFTYIRSRPENCRFQVRASYMQIYNEVISDLLRPGAQGLCIREGKDKGVYVRQLSSWPVRSPQEICSLMERGGRERVTGNTKMSELSSRSHAIFRIVVCETVTEGEGSEEIQRVKVGQLNIVDLAGSEKVRQTGATGLRLEESKYINRSLSHLGNVIAALTCSNSRAHVPYRDSKLTRILEDSLGGNCKTTMIATISPAPEAYTESLSTLKYANRAKNIKNEAVINEDLGQRGLIRKYERELERLRVLLSSVMEEKQKKGETVYPVIANNGLNQEADFREAINKVSEEYMTRLDELDKERQVIEEDKAQVDRYKQLLLKQRDIMIALTARLNERDETILQLQEELDAYDQQQKMMEEALDQKTEEVLRATQSHAAGGVSTVFTQCDLRREWIGSEVKWLRENAEGEHPTDDQFLTAEEKIYELHQHVTALRQELAMQPPNIRQRLQEAQEEKTSMEYLLKERLGAMVQAGISERVASFRREIEQWKSRHQLAEERLRNAEYTLELNRLDGLQPSDYHNKLKDIIAKEVAAVKAVHEEKLGMARQEVESRESERRQAVKEVERLQFELHSLKRRFNIDTQQIPEFDRMWQRVQQAEEDARGGVNSATRVQDQQLVWQLRMELEEANALNAKLKEENSHLQAKNAAPASLQKEVVALQRAVANNAKDREALKTIMESIKVKMDNISNLLRVCYLPATSTEQRRLETEVLQLQDLVNRSIQAM